ncbi:hypothetical protein [Streptomyces sp. NPDC001714]|uniref:hypothetical protein n=1 Tax=Streptomyces sp. NPDC001714 TaxID=3364603 RepID=UPI00369A4E26
MTDWGSVPDWVGAIGNVAVLTAAFETLRRDRARVRALEAERREQSQHTARDRVSGVCAWPEDWSGRDIHVICRNAGDEPIFDVVVRVSGEQLGQSPSVDGSTCVRSVFLMRPGEETDTNLASTTPIGARPYVDIAFRDAAGNRWWRRADGGLCTVTDAGVVIWPA